MKRTLAILAIAVTALSLSACSGEEGPLVQEARAKEKALDDERQARDIMDAAAARQINCFVAAPKAFDPVTGNPKIWIYRRDDSVLECYDTEGYHRTSRRALQKITSTEVNEILNNFDLYAPSCPNPARRCVAAPPTPAPIVYPRAPEPEPTVVPEPPSSPPLRSLGTGPCCVLKN